MRINYTNYQILEKLQQRSLGKLPIYEVDSKELTVLLSRFTKEWKECCQAFSEEINVIQMPFAKACDESSEKLGELYKDIILNDISDFSIRGTYIFGDFVHMISYDTKKGSEEIKQSYFIFTKAGTPVGFHSVHTFEKETDIMWMSRIFEPKCSADIRDWIYMQFSKMVLFKMFKTYAAVEIKILKPKQKVRDITGKYLNETKLDLTFLDSKWFTTLIKSEGFKVRGHLRFQPKKKNGEWTKELIWISEFQKTGYTAPARMLSQNAT